jgi:hypothetical protein
MVSGSTTASGSTKTTRFPQPWAYHSTNVRHPPTSPYLNEWLPGLYQSWVVPMKTSCDDSSVPPTERQLSDSWQHQQQQRYPYNNHHHAIRGPVSPDNPYKEQIEKLRHDLEEPCQACLYTGVTVCMGLSVYFANLAIDDTTLAKNRRFLWMCSVGSVAAGAYRWYLG